MHICLLSSYFPQRCGIASYTHFLAEALSASNPKVRVTVLGQKPVTKPAGVNYEVIPTYSRDGNFPEEVMQTLSTRDVDVLHIQHEYGIFGADGRMLDLLRRLRSADIAGVLTLHSVHTRLSLNAGCAHTEITRAFRRLNVEHYQCDLVQQSQLTIVHHEGAIRQVLLRQGCDRDSIAVIPHGTPQLQIADPVAAKVALGVDLTAPLLVSFGYFARSKNLQMLIRAFKRVNAQFPTAKLWLGGHIRARTPDAIAYATKCKQMLKDHRLDRDVILSEDFSDDDRLSKVLAAADICCFAYDEDTRSVSGALHTAMGFGKVVVASRIPKFHELTNIADEVLVNPRRPRELSRLIARILTDKSFREAIKERIQAYAMTTSWTRVAEAHLATYHTCLQRRRETALAA